MNEKILDDAFYTPSRFKSMLRRNDEILWEGAPNREHPTTIYEGNSKRKMQLSISIGAMFLLFASKSILVFLGGPLLLFIVIVIINDAWVWTKKKNTFYAISKDYVFIQQGTKTKIPFEKIISFEKSEDITGEATFKFIVTGDFRNPDLMFQNGQGGIGLEIIEDANIVEELLQKRIKKYER